MQMAATTNGRVNGSALTAPERVYADLRERIISFELPPGTTLGRADLAKSYAVSQTPVREALQRLEQDGLVLIYPQSKTVVAKIDVRQLSETQFLRVAVETEVVRRLAGLGRKDVINRAQAIVDMQRTLIGMDDAMPMFMDLDRTFHRTLYEAVNMEHLHVMLLDRLGQLYRCQRLELPREGKMQNIVDAHQTILDGLLAKDPDRACSAMRSHLSGTISRVETLRLEHPGYFTTDEFNWHEAP